MCPSHLSYDVNLSGVYCFIKLVCRFLHMRTHPGVEASRDRTRSVTLTSSKVSTLLLTVRKLMMVMMVMVVVMQENTWRCSGIGMESWNNSVQRLYS